MFVFFSVYFGVLRHLHTDFSGYFLLSAYIRVSPMRPVGWGDLWSGQRQVVSKSTLTSYSGVWHLVRPSKNCCCPNEWKDEEIRKTGLVVLRTDPGGAYEDTVSTSRVPTPLCTPRLSPLPRHTVGQTSLFPTSLKRLGFGKQQPFRKMGNDQALNHGKRVTPGVLGKCQGFD